jgi:hypothetical protein
MSDLQPDLFAFPANHRERISPEVPRNPPIAPAALDDAALITSFQQQALMMRLRLPRRLEPESSHPRFPHLRTYAIGS